MSGCDDGLVRLWDLQTCTPVASVSLCAGSIRFLALNPSGRYVTAACADGTVRTLSLPGLVAAGAPSRYRSPVRTICFTPHGECRITGNDQGEIEVQDFFSRKVLRRFQAHTGAVTAVRCSGSGRYLISAGSDGMIRLRDLVSGREAPVFFRCARAIHCLEFSPGGRYVTAGFSDGTIAVLDFLSSRLLALMAGFTDGEWISMTPDLYFDSSLRGAHKVMLPWKGSMTTLDQYWTLRRSTGAIRNSLAGRAEPGRAMTLPSPPELTLISPVQGSTVKENTVALRLSAKGALREVRVRVNGRPVRKGTLRGLDGGNTRELSLDVSLQPGLNTLEAEAVSEEGVTSRPCTADVQYLYPRPDAFAEAFPADGGCRRLWRQPAQP